MNDPSVASPDVAVIGSGPGGLSAAIAAARSGASVAVYDENAAPGGQLFKQTHKFFGSERHHAGVRGFEIGKRLVAEALAVGVKLHQDTAVFGIYDGGRLGVRRASGSVDFVSPRSIIIAVGATERGLPFPGWTLPGVMGAGAAQTLMNIHRVLPGRRALVVGSGNVGLIVSFQLLQAGAQVAAVVEAMPRVGGYEVHAAKIRREAVPILLRHTVLAATGTDGVESASIAEVGPDDKPIPGTLRTLDVDLILLAVGLSPQVELARMAGCATRYSPALGGHVVTCDDMMRTSIPGIFCAGDVASIEEASTAMEEGTLAGLSSAQHLGLSSGTQAEASVSECCERLRQLRLEYAPRDGLPGEQAAHCTNGPRRKRGGPVAVIECPERIPCNPCEAACRFGAITVGDDITNLPRLDESKCTGCGECVRLCPGLAIFLVDESFEPGYCAVTLPFELSHPPAEGDGAMGLDRTGRPVCEVSVMTVRPGRKVGETMTVSLRVPRQCSQTIRAFRRRP